MTDRLGTVLEVQLLHKAIQNYVLAYVLASPVSHNHKAGYL
jgi:hypothetical protein